MSDTALVQGDRVTAVWRNTPPRLVRAHRPTCTLVEAAAGAVHVGMVWRDGMFLEPPSPDLRRAAGPALPVAPPVALPALPVAPVNQSVTIHVPHSATPAVSGPAARLETPPATVIPAPPVFPQPAGPAVVAGGSPSSPAARIVPPSQPETVSPAASAVSLARPALAPPRTETLDGLRRQAASILDALATEASARMSGPNREVLVQGLEANRDKAKAALIAADTVAAIETIMRAAKIAFERVMGNG